MPTYADTTLQSCMCCRRRPRRDGLFNLLEAQTDFNREFRGDTLYVLSLEISKQPGYAVPVLKLGHVKVGKFHLSGDSNNPCLQH